MLNDYLEIYAFPIIQKIKNEKWDGKLTRKETFYLRKYLFINYLRHPIWKKINKGSKEEWMYWIKEILAFDLSDLKSDNWDNFKYVDSKVRELFIWFLKSSSFAFAKFDSKINFLLPAMMGNQYQVDLDIKDDVNLFLSKELSIPKRDMWSFYSVLDNDKVIFLRDFNFINDLNHLIFFQHDKYKINNKKINNDLPGTSEGLYIIFNESYYEARNYSINNIGYGPITNEEMKENDIYKFEWINLNYESTLMLKSDFLKTITEEEIAFPVKPRIKNILGIYIKIFEDIEKDVLQKNNRIKLIIWKKIFRPQVNIMNEIIGLQDLFF